MKKRIRLTESQLYRLIRKALNEDIASGMLVHGSEDAQINSEEDLDRFLSQHNCAGFKDLIAPKINMGDYIVPVRYAPYGSIGDWAVIEYFKQFDPNNIASEYAYNGGGAQYGFIWGSEDFLETEIDCATDQFLVDMECDLVNDEIKDLEQFYGKEFDGQLREIIFEFLFERVRAERIDYNDDELKEILNDEGFLQDNPNESLARRVTESIIRKINESSSLKQKKAVRFIENTLGIPFGGNIFNGGEVGEFLNQYLDYAYDVAIDKLKGKQEANRDFRREHLYQ